MKAFTISIVALFVALSGAAVALPGKNKVNSGDVRNESLNAADLKDGAAVTGAEVADEALGGVDVKDGQIASADVRNESIGTEDVKDGQIASADIGNESIGTEDVKAASLTGDDVADHTLSASDVGSDFGQALLNFPSIGAHDCHSLEVDPTIDNFLLGNVVAVTPSMTFGGDFSISTEIENETEFAVKVCNVTGGAGDPDGASGTLYSWVIFDL